MKEEYEPLVTLPEPTERKERVSFSIDMHEGARITLQILDDDTRMWKTLTMEEFNILMKGKIVPEFKTRFLAESKTGKDIRVKRINVTKDSK